MLLDQGPRPIPVLLSELLRLCFFVTVDLLGVWYSFSVVSLQKSLVYIFIVYIHTDKER